ncbi:MAG: histidine phosphatase family protein [Solirubrobacteraceae bacterium]|nr:histidine phosphatase family protein [Solirubrobacteraceae bacterium]
MSHQVWLLRHGEAEPHDARPDAERRLTARGEEQAAAAGRALVALETPFQFVFTSPKVRAAETARLACESLGLVPEVHTPLAEGFGLDDLRELLHIVGHDRRLLLVGHNPDFAQLVGDLTGANARVKKGGIVGMRVHGGRGELLCLLQPRELARIIARAVASSPS